MKKRIWVLAIVSIVAAPIINGCQTQSEKVENAQVRVQNADSNLKEVQKDSLTHAQKATSVEEWKIFRNESQAKIRNNEIRIEALKTKINNNGGYANYTDRERIDSLEIKNKELVTRMDNYTNGKSDWETFKLEFDRDLDGLGESLQKFTVKNHGK